MIHIIIGTKAQLIKMSPVISCLKNKGLAFNLIDLGQHSLITKNLREEFNITQPNFYFSQGENIATLQQAFFWMFKIFCKSLSSSWIKKNVFLNQNGICLIHGDTISTLIGLYLAKRARIKTAHIEAGLRSFCLLEPFPEEIIRIISMRFSDILFSPSNWAYENLTKMGFRDKTIPVPSNTGYEAARFSLAKNVDTGLTLTNFALLTAHRIENIFSKKRLNLILEIIAKITKTMPLVFVLHHPTIHQLKKFKLWEKLQAMPNITYFKILSHSHFARLLEQCAFVISDGGSIQEEAFYIGKPCLLLRKYTERDEGLNKNAVLSQFKRETIDYFISHYLEFSCQPVNYPISSSETIVNYIKIYA